MNGIMSNLPIHRPWETERSIRSGLLFVMISLFNNTRYNNNNADTFANSADPDGTARSVSSGFTLFAILLLIFD